MGEARIRQVLIGIEVTLFALVLAVSVSGAGPVALVIGLIGLMVSAVEPKRPES